MTETNKSEISLPIVLGAGLLAAVAAVFIFMSPLKQDGSAESDTATLNARIKPVVTLADITGVADEVEVVEKVAVTKSPKELYDGACLACHTTGVAGAPKLGDAEAWAARSAVGVDTLLASAKTGKGAMPPNGGSAYTEDEMKSIIEMMLSEAGLTDAAPATEAVAEPASAPAPAPAIQAMQEVVNEPVQTVSLGGSSPDLAAGETAYKTACFACHDFAVAGAPKLGDTAAWSARLATGYDALLQAALNGKGAMPAKGGAAHLSDAEVGNIVAFMMDKAK